MENTKTLKQEIENAIRSTLVVENKQSIPLAVDKIFELLKAELGGNNG